MRALKYIVKKEFLQIRRTRSMMAISIGMPLIQLLILGFAVSTDIEHVPAVVCDLDNSPSSRSLIADFEHSRYIDIDWHEPDVRQIGDYLMRGEAILALTIPPDFEKGMRTGDSPRIGIATDAQNTNVALVAAGYAKRIIAGWAGSRQPQPVSSKTSAPPGVSVSTIEVNNEIWYNPELKSVNYMVPGVIVLLVTIITIMMTALAIVREREIGTLEQLMVSPVTRFELILGKTIPFAVLGIFELVISLFISWLIYDITIAGSLATFLLTSVIFVFGTLGLGILVSTMAHTQQQALFTAWFLMIFCILMSGFFLPLENMPPFFQKLSMINPLRYFLAIVRELLLKGAGLADLKQNILPLIVFDVLVLTTAVTRFSKSLD